MQALLALALLSVAAAQLDPSTARTYFRTNYTRVRRLTSTPPRG
jgi:hypothetical protein